MSNIEASNPNAAGILEGFDRMIREAKLAGDQKEVDIIMEVRNRYCELLFSHCYKQIQRRALGDVIK